MSYLVNFANEVQSQYYNSMKTPLDVFSHLFFTNGNGYCVEDGNICEWHNMRKVYLKDSFRDSSITLDDYIEWDDRRNGEMEIDSLKQHIKEIYDFKVKKGVIEDTKPDFFELAAQEYSKRHDEVIFVSTVQYEDLFKSEYWFDCLYNSTYLRMIYISKDYYLLDKFNKNTDKDTLKIGLALCQAYLKYFSLYTNGTLVHDWKRDSIKSLDYLKDAVKLLEKNINKIETFIKA